MSTVTTTIIAADTTASQPISDAVPLDMVLSNQYRARSRNVIFDTSRIPPRKE
ncbi:hypothetical protein ACFQYP_28685 [Nonomuraea antimicrobica]